MSVITIRIDKKIIDETDNRAKNLHITRNEYIKRAIENMNETLRHNEKRQNLMRASLLVRGESMKINAEFAEIEHDPKA